MILSKKNYLTPKEVVSLWSSPAVSIAAKGCTEAGTHKVSYERSRTRIFGKEITKRNTKCMVFKSKVDFFNAIYFIDRFFHSAQEA